MQMGPRAWAPAPLNRTLPQPPPHSGRAACAYVPLGPALPDPPGATRCPQVWAKPNQVTLHLTGTNLMSFLSTRGGIPPPATECATLPSPPRLGCVSPHHSAQNTSTQQEHSAGDRGHVDLFTAAPGLERGTQHTGPHSGLNN